MQESVSPQTHTVSSRFPVEVQHELLLVLTRQKKTSMNKTKTYDVYALGPNLQRAGVFGRMDGRMGIVCLLALSWSGTCCQQVSSKTLNTREIMVIHTILF